MSPCYLIHKSTVPIQQISGKRHDGGNARGWISFPCRRPDPHTRGNLLLLPACSQPMLGSTPVTHGAGRRFHIGIQGLALRTLTLITGSPLCFLCRGKKNTPLKFPKFQNVIDISKRIHLQSAASPDSWEVPLLGVMGRPGDVTSHALSHWAGRRAAYHWKHVSLHQENTPLNPGSGARGTS